MKLSKVLACMWMSALAVASFDTQAQQARPPIRLVVGYPAGGSSDALARMLAEKLKDELGTTVIVENRPGAGGQIAADHVRGATGDGSTLLVANSHMMVMLPLTSKSAKYNPAADFKPVGRITSFYEAIAVPVSVPAASVAQWMEAARNDAKSSSFGVPAAGSVSHFLGYRLAQDAKVNLLAIPYKGAAPLVQDLLGGQIHAGILPILDVAPHHQAGKLKVLAVNGPRRAQLLPNVATLQELGIRGFETLEWTALLAPASTPAPVVAQLNAALSKVLAHKEIQERLLKLGMEANPSSPEELGQLISGDIARWGPIVKASGFTAD